MYAGIFLHFCFASAHRFFLPGDGRGRSVALTQHRAQHRAVSAPRKCSPKADANGFLLTISAPRKGCTLTGLLPNTDLVNDFEKKMKTSKCCSNTQTSFQMPTGGISAHSLHVTGSGFLRDSVPCLTLPRIEATVLKPHVDKATAARERTGS